MPQRDRFNLGLHDESDHPHRWMALSTLVLWLSVAAAGVAGPLWPETADSSESPQEALPPIEILNVELTTDPLIPSVEPVSESAVSEAPRIDVAQPVMPETPPLARVAAPSVPMVFPLPTPEPSLEVPEAKKADSVVPAAPVSEPVENPGDTVGPRQAQALVFGRGEGRQPAPRYPRTAIREGQEGAVTCVFTVEASGRVSSVEVTEPCPWPLLNEEAARVIRSRWRFRRGNERRYQITIRFQIQ